MKVSDFDYNLPEELIAQHPLEQRDSSRLLVDGATGAMAHRKFTHLPEYLRLVYIIVANDTRVIPARIFARKLTGCQILLLEETETTHGKRWSAAGRSRKG